MVSEIFFLAVAREYFLVNQAFVKRYERVKLKTALPFLTGNAPILSADFADYAEAKKKNLPNLCHLRMNPARNGRAQIHYELRDWVLATSKNITIVYENK